jgi:putative phage-type endonuclease
MQQGTNDWFQARCGVVTASRFSDVLMKPTTAGYMNYRAEIIAERLTGKPAESYQSKEMMWGVEQEDNARKVYELVNDIQVDQVGLIKHADIEAGASPDGVIGDGLIEIKCPNTSTHIKTLLEKRHPRQYEAQMQGQMWITGAKWCDFISYDPRLDDKNAFFSVRVYRDDAYIKNLDKAVRVFLHEVDQLIKKLEK